MSRSQKAPRGLAALYRVLLVAPPANDVEPPAAPVTWARFQHAGACVDPACVDFCQEGLPHPWETPAEGAR